MRIFSLFNLASAYRQSLTRKPMASILPLLASFHEPQCQSLVIKVWQQIGWPNLVFISPLFVWMYSHLVVEVPVITHHSCCLGQKKSVVIVAIAAGTWTTSITALLPQKLMSYTSSLLPVPSLPDKTNFLGGWCFSTKCIIKIIIFCCCSSVLSWNHFFFNQPLPKKTSKIFFVLLAVSLFSFVLGLFTSN